MKRLQKATLVLSIIFCINFALHSLLGFDMIDNFLMNYLWAEKLYAFLIGVCGFSNILIFKNDK